MKKNIPDMALVAFSIAVTVLALWLTAQEQREAVPQGPVSGEVGP